MRVGTVNDSSVRKKTVVASTSTEEYDSRMPTKEHCYGMRMSMVKDSIVRRSTVVVCA
jgi:hypothetical protein